MTYDMTVTDYMDYRHDGMQRKLLRDYRYRRLLFAVAQQLCHDGQCSCCKRHALAQLALSDREQQLLDPAQRATLHRKP